MSQRLELIDIQGEIGFVVPEDILSQFDLKAGDELVVEQVGRSLFVRPVKSNAAIDPDKP